LKPNTEFKLTVRDIEIIEDALLQLEQTAEIQGLLGRIHNQKNWYRPSKEVYIGG
jgi:hypothetical protein